MVRFCSDCNRSLYPFEESQDHTMCTGCRMTKIKKEKLEKGTWTK